MVLQRWGVPAFILVSVSCATVTSLQAVGLSTAEVSGTSWHSVVGRVRRPGPRLAVHCAGPWSTNVV